jgi:hypothetical protein
MPNGAEFRRARNAERRQRATTVASDVPARRLAFSAVALSGILRSLAFCAFWHFALSGISRF